MRQRRSLLVGSVALLVFGVHGRRAEFRHDGAGPGRARGTERHPAGWSARRGHAEARTLVEDRLNLDLPEDAEVNALRSDGPDHVVAQFTTTADLAETFCTQMGGSVVHREISAEDREWSGLTGDHEHVRGCSSSDPEHVLRQRRALIVPESDAGDRVTVHTVSFMMPD